MPLEKQDPRVVATTARVDIEANITSRYYIESPHETQARRVAARWLARRHRITLSMAAVIVAATGIGCKV